MKEPSPRTGVRSSRVVVGALLSYVVFEIVCFYGVQWTRNNTFLIYYPIQTESLAIAFQESVRRLLDGKTEYLGFDATLGWTVKPRGNSPLYQANGDGIRASRDYDVWPPPGKIRVGAFGDSFTHADDVSNADMWEEQLAGLDPRLEVINFGVPAYGLDQALLRYEHKGKGYHHRIVLIGFFSGDLARHASTFFPFVYPLGGIPLAKPRYVLDGAERLTLVDNPVREANEYRALLEDPEPMLARLGERDFLFRHGPRWSVWSLLPSVSLYQLMRANFWRDESDPGKLVEDGRFTRASEPYRVTLRLIETFHEHVRRDGATPVVILFPGQIEVIRRRQNQSISYEPLKEDLKGRGIRVLDLLDALGTQDLEEVVFQTRLPHYSPKGNALAARAIHTYLKDEHLLD